MSLWRLSRPNQDFFTGAGTKANFLEFKLFKLKYERKLETTVEGGTGGILKRLEPFDNDSVGGGRGGGVKI